MVALEYVNIYIRGEFRFWGEAESPLLIHNKAHLPIKRERGFVLELPLWSHLRCTYLGPECSKILKKSIRTGCFCYRSFIFSFCGRRGGFFSPSWASGDPALSRHLSMLWVPLDPHYCKLSENRETSPWFCPVFPMLWGVCALLAAALIHPPSLYLNFLVLLINIPADSFNAVVCFGEMGSHFVTRVGLTLYVILLPQPPKRWDSQSWAPCPVENMST